MGHVFMERMAESLANEHIATLRFNFPYTEKGSKRPDHAPVLIETIQAAYKIAQENAIGIPILAGGKSMGGRMTSMAASMGLLSGIKGVAFFGFPLHAPGKPSGDRAEHLYLINEPMLFLQGSKDKLADLALLKPVIAKLGSNAKLYVVEGADHSFHLPKSSGRTDEDVFRELAKKVKEWADEIKQ
jgi:predicted alpha/beta-hydrolase family hydrolase